MAVNDRRQTGGRAGISQSGACLRVPRGLQEALEYGEQLLSIGKKELEKGTRKKKPM